MVEPEQLDSVAAQLARQFQRVRAVELVVSGARGFQTHPHPRNAQFHQFAHGVLADGVSGGEHVQSPRLRALLHAAQELHGAPFVEQEVLVHHEERAHVQLAFHLRHDAEELVAAVVEIQIVALASEKRGRRAEVAAHGATDRRNDGGRGVALALRQLHPERARAEAGYDFRVADGGVRVFAQVAPHPGDAVAFHHVIDFDHQLDAGDSRHMAAHHDGRPRRNPPHHLAHLADLADVHDDGGNAHDVVIVGAQLGLKSLARRKIQDRGWSGDVPLDHQDAP